MIVKLEVEETNPNEGKLRDNVIRAIDRVLGEATWEANGEGWIARR